MKRFFADLHVHLGRAGNGAPVKITASRSLTLPAVLEECQYRKGIDMVGIVDTASPPVQADLEHLIAAGELRELTGGGLQYRDRVTLILAAEVETAENLHCLIYVPDFESLAALTKFLSGSGRIKNVSLSSQRCGLILEQLVKLAGSLEGFLVPAHAFTPHKGMYGSRVRSALEILSEKAWQAVPAIELGLSSDTRLADMISELQAKTFISNSDAHSLPKIAREYNILQSPEADFRELGRALRREGGRAIAGNFGFDPRLGKYHRTYCERCQAAVEESPPVFACPRCGGAAGSSMITPGVLDRIFQIRDQVESRSPSHRPRYVHQIPLANLPGIGSKTLARLLQDHTEMEILHFLNEEQIAAVTSPAAASQILRARAGILQVRPGGGGRYGRVVF